MIAIFKIKNETNSLLQKVNIDDKIKNAPDSSYLVGVWIGYVLPFVILAGIALDVLSF